MTVAAQSSPGVQESAEKRLSINRLGMWFFILSETMLFIGILMVRFSLVGTYSHEDLSQFTGLIITVILLFSSFTAYRAEHAMAKGDVDAVKRNLRLTIGLGAVFAAGVAYEWYEALNAFPPSILFGSVFFTMTGLHAFHVLTGLLMLAIVLRRVKAGDVSSAASWPVEASVKYWHFVDVVWVFFYPALYLIS